MPLTATLTERDAWDALATVADPEIPVISLVELGVIRAVAVAGARVSVSLTPTFSGCPALVEMRRLIDAALRARGFADVALETVLAPAWSSDWISDAGRRKLKAFGLAPPARHGGNIVQTFFDPVACPRCDSTHTTLKNSFGSTLCRAIWQCADCQETFEQFKPL